MPLGPGTFFFKRNYLFLYEYLFLFLLVIIVIQGKKGSKKPKRTSIEPRPDPLAKLTTKLCVQLDRNTLRGT